jgi:hypothetical protein
MIRHFSDVQLHQPRPWNWIDTLIVGVSLIIGTVVILVTGLLVLMLG